MTYTAALSLIEIHVNQSTSKASEWEVARFWVHMYIELLFVNHTGTPISPGRGRVFKKVSTDGPDYGLTTEDDDRRTTDGSHGSAPSDRLRVDDRRYG
jgi:hypothetical protein